MLCYVYEALLVTGGRKLAEVIFMVEYLFPCDSRVPIHLSCWTVLHFSGRVWLSICPRGQSWPFFQRQFFHLFQYLPKWPRCLYTEEGLLTPRELLAAPKALLSLLSPHGLGFLLSFLSQFSVNPTLESHSPMEGKRAQWLVNLVNRKASCAPGPRGSQTCSHTCWLAHPFSGSWHFLCVALHVATSLTTSGPRGIWSQTKEHFCPEKQPQAGLGLTGQTFSLSLSLGPSGSLRMCLVFWLSAHSPLSLGLPRLRPEFLCAQALL